MSQSRLSYRMSATSLETHSSAPPPPRLWDAHGGGGGASPRFCTRLPNPRRSGPKAPRGGGGRQAAEEGFSGEMASR